MKRLYSLAKVVIGILIVCGILFVVWPVKKIPVSYVALEAGDVEEVITPLYNALVQANRFVHIRSTLPGEVKKIMVKEGDRVKEGDLVVELKNDEQFARLQLSQANLAAGIASSNQTKIKSDSSKKSLGRIKKLFESGLVSESSLDQAATEWEMIQKSLDITGADIEQLQASLKIARSLYDATFIRAPFDGCITDILVEERESIVPGAPMYDIYDDTSLHIMARFDEIDSSRLYTGLEARITSDTIQGRHLKGKIEWISNVVNVDLKSGRGVDVKISFQEREPSIRIGMSVEVEVVVNVKTNVHYLPTPVIMGKGGEKFVYAIEEGRASKRLVTVGLSSWDRTEVLDGVNETDKIISSVNLSELKEGARVIVQ